MAKNRKERKRTSVQGAILEFYFRLAHALAVHFGPECEVVVHDLETNDPESSIVYIENGHVSGRKVGDGPSQVVLEALKSDRSKLEDHLNYLTRTKDGKILKSSTLYIRDDTGKTLGIFSINHDISLMLSLQKSMEKFTSAALPEKEPAEITCSVADLLDELIEKSVALVGKPAALMNKEDKIRALRFLNDTGAFLITKSGDKVCKYFGISKYTLYSYIDEAKS